MISIKKIILLLLFFPLSGISQSTQLSNQSEISVITCGPGNNELYATFGHSAFRVFDPVNKIDRVYNYGTFDFNVPNFYLNFAKGKLLYQLRAYNFGNFLQGYHQEKRWVKEQVLDLNTNDVQKIYEYLENNAKIENRSYQYDFFYNNCSTKLYEVLEIVLGDKIIFDNTFDSKQYTHRDLIQLYLNYHPWGDFGIDLALGSVIDQKASAKEYMFLPDFVFEAFTKITVVNNSLKKPIVKQTNNVLSDSQNTRKNNLLTPIVVFSILSILIVIRTYFDYKKGTRNKVLDFILFFTTGSIGLVVLLLWFATNHTATFNNYNIFWAFAPNLIFAFLMLKNVKISYWYLISVLFLLGITIFIWLFSIQAYHIALLPILIALGTRYVYLIWYFKKGLSLK